MTGSTTLAPTEDLALWNHITEQVWNEVKEDLDQHHRPYAEGLSDYTDDEPARFKLTRWQRACFNVPFTSLWMLTSIGATWWASAAANWDWNKSQSFAGGFAQTGIILGILAGAVTVFALSYRVRRSGSFVFKAHSRFGRSMYDYAREARRVIDEGVKNGVPIAADVQPAAEEVIVHFSKLLDVHIDLCEKIERASGVIQGTNRASLKESYDRVGNEMMDTVVDLLAAARIVHAAGQTLETFSALSAADDRVQQAVDSRIAEILPDLLRSRQHLADVSTAWQSAALTVDSINHKVLA